MAQKKIPKKFITWINQHFKESKDLVDVEHEYDRTLTVGENQQIFEDKFKCYFVEKQLKMSKKEMSEAEAKLKKDDNLTALESRFGMKIEMV
jgi:hypothetical protein